VTSAHRLQYTGKYVADNHASTECTSNKQYIIPMQLQECGRALEFEMLRAGPMAQFFLKNIVMINKRQSSGPPCSV
jgi:hypothetical protein